MKNPAPEAQRWLRQAEHDLQVARGLAERTDHAEACYFAEQSAQKALKAFLTARGERFVLAHSVRKLAQECAGHDPAFGPLTESGAMLDRYYLTTRYPDALPFPAVPYEAFSASDSAQALAAAARILEAARKGIGSP